MTTVFKPLQTIFIQWEQLHFHKVVVNHQGTRHTLLTRSRYFEGRHRISWLLLMIMLQFGGMSRSILFVSGWSSQRSFQNLSFTRGNAPDSNSIPIMGFGFKIPFGSGVQRQIIKTRISQNSARSGKDVMATLYVKSKFTALSFRDSRSDDLRSCYMYNPRRSCDALSQVVSSLSLLSTS